MFWRYKCWKLVKWLLWELMMNGAIALCFPKIKSAQILRVIHLRVDQEMMNRCRKTDRTKKKLLTLHALRKIEPYYSAVVELGAICGRFQGH